MPLKKPSISPFAALVVGAVLLGIGVAWLVVHTLQNREAAAAAALQARLDKNRVEVVVPTRNLKPGSVADSSDMATRSVPRSVIYPQTITTATWPQYGGRVLNQPVYQGRPILSTDFGPVTTTSFAAELAPGQRAFTIDVSGVNSIASLLLPGNRIDLLLLANGPQGSEVLPLLRHIRVLATGHNTTPQPMSVGRDGTEPAPHYGTITLALTPAQVAKLALAEQVGSIRVALVPQQSPTAGPLPTLLKGDLFGVVPTPSSPPTIQYIIGGPGKNQVSELPIATPLPRSPASPSSLVQQKAVLAHEQQELQTLNALVHAASPTTATPLPPAAALPKGYP